MFFTGEPDFKELSSDPELVASWALPSIKLNFNRKIQKTLLSLSGLWHTQSPPLEGNQ